MARIIKKHSKIVLIIGLVLMLVAMYATIPTGQAAQLTNREVKLSDSRPGQEGVNYDFEADGSATNIYCIKVEFCTSTSGTCVKPPNMSFDSPTTTSSGWNNLNVGNWKINATGTTWISATTSSAGEQLGTNGSFVFGNITNSNTAAIYYAKIHTYENQNCATSELDTGTVAFALISGVTVSATVAETLSFSIAEATNANCSSYFTTLNGPDTNATSVSFGTLAAVDTFYHGCQDLTLSTNASSGYSVVVQETTNLRDTGTSINIEDSTGDSNSMSESVTSTWATASGNAGFGYACANISGSDCVMPATSTYRQFACKGSGAQCDPGAGGETAQSIMSNTSAVSSKQSMVEYKLTVAGTQQAGNYSNAIVYIATPTY